MTRWAPIPGPQLNAIMAQAVPELLYGGARGGGKTEYLLGDFCSGATIGPAWTGVLLRKSYPELDEIIQRSQVIVPSCWPGSEWFKQEKRWRLPNGAMLTLRSLEQPEDAAKLQGFSFTWIGWDELGQFPTDTAYKALMATLRSAYDVPFKRVRATANPGGPGHCVPFGEVLTPSGWRDIREMEPGDAVMTVDADGYLTETVVAQKHVSMFEGEMVRVRARGLRLTCTPNHRVAKVNGTKHSRGDAFALVPFEELPGQATVLRTVKWEGRSIGVTTPWVCPTRKRKLQQPTMLASHDYCAVVGWLLSEGCLVDRDKAISFAQSKPGGREALRFLLEDRCGFHVSWSQTQATVYAPDWWAHFRDLGCGEGSRHKRIPLRVKNAAPDELQELLDALMDGDGHWGSDDGGNYYTISRQLADDVAEIALKLGYVVSMTSRQRHNRKGMSYDVSIKRTKSGGTELLTGNHVYDVTTETQRQSQISREPFYGPVYCLGIEDTHTFVIRQEGTVWVSGNSWIKQRFIDPHPLGYQPITDPDTGMTRVYIPARVQDNTILLTRDPSYVNRLKGVGSPELVRAWLEGDWTVVVGAYFPEFSINEHVVEPRELPLYWHRFRSLDWGSARPFAVHWWAVSDGELPRFPRGALICYREWYGALTDANGVTVANTGLRMTAEEVADGILVKEKNDLTGNRIMGGIADPSIFAEDGGPSIADRMMLRKCFWREGDNKRVARLGAMGGWDQLRARLKGDGEKPAVYFFSTCRDIIRTLPLLQHDNDRPEDVDTEGEDHAADSVRYACMSRPYTAPLPDELDPPTDRYSRRRRISRYNQSSGWAA